jgi:hypothetical protein
VVASEGIIGTQEASIAEPQTEGKKGPGVKKTQRRGRGKAVPSFTKEKTAVAEN